MVWRFYMIDDDYGNRVGEGLGIGAGDVAQLQPLPRQQLTEEDQQRLVLLGNNPSRKLTGEQIMRPIHIMRADEASANGSTDGPAAQASEMQHSGSGQ